MSVLADTSVWVSFLRKGGGDEGAALDALLEGRQVVMCGPVAAELLMGARPDQRDALWRLLDGLAWSSLERHHWRQAGDTAAQLRVTGVSVPLTDVLIAIAASSVDAALWSLDSDFDRIASVLPALRRYQPQ